MNSNIKECEIVAEFEICNSCFNFEVFGSSEAQEMDDYLLDKDIEIIRDSMNEIRSMGMYSEIDTADFSFSCRPCDCCGQVLAGDRFKLKISN